MLKYYSFRPVLKYNLLTGYLNYYNFLLHSFYIKNMSNPTIKEREMKFSKLCDNLKIKLIKGTKSNISYMKKYIMTMENTLKQSLLTQISKTNILPIFKLSFRILSFPSYVDIKAIKIISSMVETNEYKLLGATSDKLDYALKQLGHYKQ